MSRPATYADLPSYSRKGSTVISVSTSELPTTGATFKAIGALLDSIPVKGYEVENEYNSITVSKTKTTEELDTALRAMQFEWDANQEKFTLWEDDLSVPEATASWAIGNILAWARKEVPDTDLSWLEQAHSDARVREIQKKKND